MKIEDIRDELHKALFSVMTAKDEADERKARNLVLALGVMLATEEIEIATTMSREELIQQQRELQDRKTAGWVVVFPSDGMCSYCGHDLLDSYTPLELTRDFISGCRKCNKSYVD